MRLHWSGLAEVCVVCEYLSLIADADMNRFNPSKYCLCLKFLNSTINKIALMEGIMFSTASHSSDWKGSVHDYQFRIVLFALLEDYIYFSSLTRLEE